jgi:hypothetical protein
MDDLANAGKHVAKIVWFTYRKKLGLTSKINSDVGWGCLLRVGQMVLMQGLLR